MMGGRVVRRRLVARSAHAVALGPQARGVRVVAVGARNAARVHAALQERAVLVVLVEDLPVGLVEPLVEEGHAVRLREGLAGTPVLADLRAPRVAPPAALDLRARVARSGEPCDRSTGVERPGAVPRREARLEPFRRVAGRALTVGPGEVPGAGSVAGLAGDVDLRPARREAVLLRVVLLPDAGRVALGAHVVPVLRRTGPVQDVVEVDLVLGIEVEPPLPARGLRARVPRDAERLQAAARKLDQVLLQGRHAEGVPDLVVGELAVGAVGVNVELLVAPEEA